MLIFILHTSFPKFHFFWVCRNTCLNDFFKLSGLFKICSRRTKLGNPFCYHMGPSIKYVGPFSVIFETPLLHVSNCQHFNTKLRFPTKKLDHNECSSASEFLYFSLVEEFQIYIVFITQSIKCLMLQIFK